MAVSDNGTGLALGAVGMFAALALVGPAMGRGRGSPARYRIGASSLRGTYTAGVFEADSEAEAIEMARAAYRRSEVGRQLKDVGAFRFYVLADEPDDTLEGDE